MNKTKWKILLANEHKHGNANAMVCSMVILSKKGLRVLKEMRTKSVRTKVDDVVILCPKQM